MLVVVCRPWLLTIDLKQGHSNESIRPIWHDGLNFKPSDEGRVFAFWEKGVHPMFFSKQEKEKHILKRRHGMGHGMVNCIAHSLHCIALHCIAHCNTVQKKDFLVKPILLKPIDHER